MWRVSIMISGLLCFVLCTFYSCQGSVPSFPGQTPQSLCCWSLSHLAVFRAHRLFSFARPPWPLPLQSSPAVPRPACLPAAHGCVTATPSPDLTLKSLLREALHSPSPGAFPASIYSVTLNTICSGTERCTAYNYTHMCEVIWLRTSPPLDSKLREWRALAHLAPRCVPCHRHWSILNTLGMNASMSTKDLAVLLTPSPLGNCPTRPFWISLSLSFNPYTLTPPPVGGSSYGVVFGHPHHSSP